MKKRKMFNATMGALILMSVGQPIMMSMSANSVLADTASNSSRGAWVGDLIAGSTKVSGTAAPGADIYVYHVISAGNTTCLGSAKADSNGNWTANVRALLPNESIQVESSNENGVTHYTPIYSVVASTARPTVGDLDAGSKKVSGTAAPSSEVRVYKVYSGGYSTQIGDTTSDGNGNWSATVSGLSPNTSVQVQSLNDGGVSHYTNITPVVYARPMIESALVVGSQTVSGVASPNSNINVYQVNGPGDSSEMGSTTTDSDGHWTLTTTRPLEGGKSFQVESTVDGSDRYTDILPIVYKYVTPTITGDIKEGMDSLRGTATAGACVDVWVNGKNLATVQADKDGNWSAGLGSRLAPTDTVKIGTVAGGKNYNSDTYTVGRITPTITGELTEGMNSLSGTAAPGATVDVFENGVNIATRPADKDGNWSGYLSSRLAVTETVKVVSSIDGKCSTSDTYTVGRITPTITGGLTSGSHNVSGTGAPGATVDVFENGVNVSTATVGDDGNWTSTWFAGLIGRGLSGGDTVKAVTSIDGKCSTSDTHNIAVGAPEITKICGFSVSGTADPGAKITIYASHIEGIFGGKRAIGTGTADSDGNFKINSGDYGIIYGCKVQAKATLNGIDAYSSTKERQKDDTNVTDESDTLYSSFLFG